ncbi:hypothetical protein LOC68_16915 [Blastopirellula sp. JC732]|uniref:Type II secretion system protein GspG C-terminal domain-containing protein n=1 Tax=Blastopirellula sediminis TaxID=2894196 RepID=A0A9X1MP04_9BACT|nr:hypothetical protein [Blastopirellula sediminis]MCC9606627.1 hypothetical protein [Blastopirellula sediminis]MCC9630076.1 hypothetical protein [Blastopirellula sediminis]
MKKSTIYFWIFGVVALLVVLLLVWIVVGPSGPIIVSKQTTFLTEPLRSDGLVDYPQAILNMQGKNVSPEENAAIPFLQATWPCELSPEHQPLVCDELQMPMPPVDGMKSLYNEQLRSLVGEQLGKMAPQTGTAPPQPLAQPEVHEIISAAHNTPWTRDQLPAVADWLDEQQPHFAKLHEMNDRPKFYLPSPSLLDHKNDYLFASLLPTVQHQRDAARSLSVRAMLAIGENRPYDAWEDIKTSFRLSNCYSQPGFLIELLVCNAIRGMAIQQLMVLLSSEECDAALLDEIEKYLAGLQPYDEMAPSIDTMERIAGLDAAIAFSTHKVDAQEMLGGGNDAAVGTLTYAPFDRNAMLARLNVWYDRIAATAEIDDLEERQKAMEQLEIDLQAETQGAVTAGNIAGAIFNQTARGELIAQVLAGLLLPAVTQAVWAEERLNLQMQMTRVAVALEKYKLEKGDYPDTLAPLENRIDPALLKDPYSPAQLRYQKRPPGFLVYSVSRDRIDNGGNSHDGEIVAGEWITGSPVSDWKKGDFVIRIPMPKKSLADFFPLNQPADADGDATAPVEEEPLSEEDATTLKEASTPEAPVESAEETATPDE